MAMSCIFRMRNRKQQFEVVVIQYLQWITEHEFDTSPLEEQLRL